MATISSATWQYVGHTYALYKELKTWDAASLFAKQLGGYLVKIDSTVELVTTSQVDKNKQGMTPSQLVIDKYYLVHGAL